MLYQPLASESRRGAADVHSRLNCRVKLSSHRVQFHLGLCPRLLVAALRTLSVATLAFLIVPEGASAGIFSSPGVSGSQVKIRSDAMVD